MKLETENRISEEATHPLPYTPKTPLGEKLLSIRARIEAAGQPLLDWDEIEKEVSARRGGHQNNTL